MPVDVFAFVAALVALGYALRFTSALPANTAEALNAVVLYVCLPAAVLRYAPALELEPALVAAVVTPWLLFAVAGALAAGLGRAAGWSRAEVGAWWVCVGLGNSSFLGIPIVRAVLGEPSVRYAVVYDQLGTFLVLSTAGLAVVAWASGGEAPTARDVALRVARFPAVWALLVGATVMPASPPAWVAGGLQRLADAILPLVLLAVGLSLRLRLGRAELGPVASGLAARLALMPALAWGVCRVMDAPDAIRDAVVLESAMPSMVSAAALAMAAGLAPRTCAALVGYGIAASMVTLPAWTAVLSR